MSWFSFGERPLWLNLAVFIASAVVVWIAGSRVARWADRFAGASGIGHATVGLVLLAGITSLPEVAVTLTAAAAASPSLAVNNLLGSIAMQIAILAVADAMLGKEALTVVAGTGVVLLQVTLNILLLVVLAIALLTGDTPLLGAGVWSWGLLLLYAAAIWIVSHAEDRQLWVAKKTRFQKQKARREAEKGGEPAADPDEEPEPLRPLVWKLAFGGLAILVAGFLLSRTGEAIAEQTGLGQSFFGAVFVAISTSLPEVSSVVAAVKLHRYEMAISDIFGTNLFNVGLVFLVDLVHPGKPVIGAVGNFAMMGSLLGALLASIYLVGLIERRDRTLARMGIDSFAVLAVYLAGVVLLYRMR